MSRVLFNNEICSIAFFQTTIQFLQQINVKKRHDHPVSGAGKQTNDLWNVSLLPYPLDHGLHLLLAMSLSSFNSFWLWSQHWYLMTKFFSILQ